MYLSFRGDGLMGIRRCPPLDLGRLNLFTRSRSGGDLSALIAVITSVGTADCANISEVQKSTITRAGNNSFMAKLLFLAFVLPRDLCLLRKTSAEITESF